MKRSIKALTNDQFIHWLAAHGQPAFRAEQVRRWLYDRWAVDFEEMTNLPGALRDQLTAAFSACGLVEENRQQADEGTVKFLCALLDGQAIETVYIPTGRRRTVCVSTQVGCPVRCAFCASGRGGLIRNLTRDEMIDQVIHVQRWAGAPVTNLVVMGMGEPMLNLAELIPALETVCDPLGLGLSARHVTVSTSGIPTGIRQLADEKRPWNLALSLHATTDAARARLIPPEHRFPISEILAACDYYRNKTTRMVTFEYALVRGMNDSPKDAGELAAMAKRLRAKINLIPCNASSAAHLSPSPERIQQFLKILAGAGARVTLRESRGEQIQAACGQLRTGR
ncbi:MAG: 23S rRNA (adenine(2503)-C(2))-methyltransferase RlmN [Lentisphaeria bacterium]|nr:23S rRNA (adenine(2503)-C(2))-methyltransferase RlmN [Lentisphaeria bacterium]